MVGKSGENPQWKKQELKPLKQRKRQARIQKTQQKQTSAADDGALFRHTRNTPHEGESNLANCFIHGQILRTSSSAKALGVHRNARLLLSMLSSRLWRLPAM